MEGKTNYSLNRNTSSIQQRSINPNVSNSNQIAINSNKPNNGVNPNYKPNKGSTQTPPPSQPK